MRTRQSMALAALWGAAMLAAAALGASRFLTLILFPVLATFSPWVAAARTCPGRRNFP